MGNTKSPVYLNFIGDPVKVGEIPKKSLGLLGEEAKITSSSELALRTKSLYMCFKIMRRLVLTTTRNSSTSSKVPSFHKRQLPVSLTAMASPAGKQLFREALGEGGLESYFPLAEQFVTQSEPSFCSVSTLAMVLNALSFDPKKVWKGSWRWVSEEMLQCASPRVCGHSMEKIKTDGLSFVQFESLARCHGVKISSHRVVAEPEDHEEEEDPETAIPCPESIDRFRILVEKISTDDQAGTFIVVNFSRKVLNQTGDGHFSPIGGYHREKDLVLIMDVARFKYPPYWVPLTQLWAAMAEPDLVSGEPRGYFVISGWNDRAPQAASSAEASVYSGHVHCSHPMRHTTTYVHHASCGHEHHHDHEHSHQHGAHCTHASHAHDAPCHVQNCSHSHHCSHKQKYNTQSTHASTVIDTAYSSSNAGVQGSRIRHSAISTSSLAQQNEARVHEEPSLNMRSPALCPPMIRTWQDFKKYEPRGSCCPKHRKLADQHATAEWFASVQ